MSEATKKYFAKFDASGFAQAFYCDDFHDAKDIANDATEITEAQWTELSTFPWSRRWDGSQVAEYTPPTREPEPIIIVLPAVTLWERMTEAEADQVAEVMATQPFRTRKIFETAATFRSDHELWPLLEQIATELFGEGRAAELLAGSLPST